jgi:hypothetical protein
MNNNLSQKLYTQRFFTLNLIEKEFIFTKIPLSNIFNIEDISAYQKPSYNYFIFRMSLDEIKKITNNINSFSINFEIYKNKENEKETIINIMFRSALPTKINKYLISKMNKYDYLIETINDNDFLLIYKEDSKEKIEELIGNLLLFCFKPSIFMSQILDFENKCMDNYKLINLDNY